MDKRGTKILIGCILCTMIVLMLFLIAFRFSQLSCELVSLEPSQLKRAQLTAFMSAQGHSKSSQPKPIRSHDKTLLMKMSAYLEYNIQRDEPVERSSWLPFSKPSSSSSSSSSRQNNLDDNLSASSSPNPASNFLGPMNSQAPNGNLSSSSAVTPTTPSHQNLHQHPNTTTTTTANNNNNNNSNNSLPVPIRSNLHGPGPSVPLLGLQPPAQNTGQNAHRQNQQQQQQPSTNQKAHRRFAPLKLSSIESRYSSDASRQTYILNFNCTKLNMVVVRLDSGVYVESINLELSPASRRKTTCEIQLPPEGAFGVKSVAAQVQQTLEGVAGSGASSAKGNSSLASGQTASNLAPTQTANTHKLNKNKDKDKEPKDYSHLAHYYCHKPLHYNCYHYDPKSGPNQSNGLLLAELHINGIEFETSTVQTGDKKQLKSDFKTKGSPCQLP